MVDDLMADEARVQARGIEVEREAPESTPQAAFASLMPPEQPSACASETHLREVLAGMPGLISTFDRNGIYTLSVGQALATVGLRPGERVGQSLFVVHRERPQMLEAARLALQGQTTITSHDLCGHVFENHWTPLHDAAGQITGIMCVGIDVTERRRAEMARLQAEAEARAASERYWYMFEANPAIKLIIDTATGRILEANAAACDFYGYSRDAITSKRLWDIDVRSEAEVRATMARMDRAQRLSFTIQHRLASGEIRDVEVYSAPVHTEEHSAHYIIIHDVTERKRAEEALQRQALHDALTGLPNRVLLQDRLDLALRAAALYQQPITLLLLDLDRFKEINDTFGHQEGDQLLCEVAARLCASLRASDTIARLGGDEFAVLLPGTDEGSATAVAAKLSTVLETPFVLGEHTLHVRASIGIALAPGHGSDVLTLLRRADVAMYAAKRAGGGHCIYDPAYDRHSPQRLALEHELRQVIADRALILHYQPTVDVRSGRVVGVEALVRWPHPCHDLIPPDQFIPLAEQSGLIIPLTHWVLEESIRQCQIWERAGLRLEVAANLSVRALHDPMLPGALGWLLRCHGIPANRITLEITESALMADPNQAQRVLAHLTEIGVHLAIDDFGTGYSSLAYLKQLPVDAVKIDKVFVQNMGTAGTKDNAIVRSIIELGHNLGLLVVAEGVEDEETWHRLAAVGCDVAQGYYLCRPLAATEFEHWLRAQEGPPRPVSSFPALRS